MGRLDVIKEKGLELLEKIKENKIVLLSVVAFIFVMSFVYYGHEKKSDHIAHGIKIDGIKVAGLNKEEAKKKIEKTKEDEIKDEEINFIFGEKNYKVPVRDLGYSLNTNEVVNEAYNIGKTNNVFKDYFNIIGAGIFRKNIKLNETFNEEKVNLALDQLDGQIHIEPINAHMYVKDDDFKIVKESNGRAINRKKTKELIDNYLNDKKDVELVIKTLKPSLYEKDFNGIDSLLAEYSTNYSSSGSNRKENISLGASFFDGILLEPNKEISFNAQTGGITEEQGFKTAGVILNGELDSGIGGGICQVSTTLYNALIRADVDITERYNHSRPIGYVPLGTDAAVVDGYKDLKFVNNGEYPLYLKSYTDGNNVKFKVYGNKKSNDYDINIVPKLVSVKEPREIKKYSTKLPSGQTEIKSSGSKGYYYETYKEYVKDGEVVNSEKISNSNYVAKDRVVVIGEGENKIAKEKEDNKDRS